jgi:hypothetical protein
LFIFLLIIIVKNCRIKKPSAKVKIEILINYSATNFQNGKGTTIPPKVISLENLQPPMEVKALGPSLARPFGEAYLAIFP